MRFAIPFSPCLSLLLCLTAFARSPRFPDPPALFPEPLSPRIANYDIAVSLDVPKRLLRGQEVLTWKNTSPDQISELYLHLYLNAFRNNQSTLMLEAGRRYRGLPKTKKGWGYSEINRMVLLPKSSYRSSARFFHNLTYQANRLAEGRDVTAQARYVQPDTPEHLDDKTVLYLPLPEALLPGDSLLLFIDFTAQLPEPPYASTGVQKEFSMVGQWFPKAGVYLDGQWNCHQFHTNSEFFADFGVYNVWITLPEDHIVGATGGRVGEPLPNGDGTVTHFYHAEDVHDFAWTASPEFVEFKGRAEDVDIRALMQPDHAAQGPRHVEAARIAIEAFQKRYGDYPFPNLTVVDPRRGARETSGMEYPTLITAGTSYGVPEGIRLPEAVVIHEFGHNYWYHMVASNEFEESWLDEGITSFSEMQIMDDYYRPAGGMIDFLGIRLDNRQYQRLGYLSAPDFDPMVRKAWEYYSSRSYGVNSYSKPALMLLTLQNYLGEETMARILRTYLERWRFKHPRSGDFIAVANEVAGQDLSEFFAQALYTNAVLDYSVDRVLSREVEAPQGYDYDFSVGQEETAAAVPEGDSEGDSLADAAAVDSAVSEKPPVLYQNWVNIRRLGDFTFPVEVEVLFDNGEVVRETWDGKALWKKFSYIKPTRIVSATVDPDHKVAMDLNFTNNSKLLEKRAIGANKLSLRWLFWAQFIMDQPEFLNLLTALGILF